MTKFALSRFIFRLFILDVLNTFAVIKNNFILFFIFLKAIKSDCTLLYIQFEAFRLELNNNRIVPLEIIEQLLSENL